MAFTIATAACGPMSAVLPAPELPPPVSQPGPATTLFVGTARADVTPPPGVSFFGHGPEARVADGYWSRLYCRVFVFRPDRATPLAITTCDLGGVGTLLQRSVAQLLADSRVPIPASRLMITATHTHAAPAHYFEGDFYGGFMSSRLPGFDRKMLDFFSTRIAKAIERAYRGAKPAALSAAHTAVWGLTRNRSLVPFQQNQPAYVPGSDCTTERAPAGLLPEQQAINPCLDVIRIDEIDAAGKRRGPLGSISFFAMHPTVLPNTTRLLNADAFGAASRSVESAMRKEWQKQRPEEAATRDPIHAVINTNEGDISPAWLSGSSEEAVAIGEKLAQRIVEASERNVAAVPPIVNARYVEVHLPSAPLFGTEKRLCETPTLGVAMPKGAADHPTALTLVGDFVDENVSPGSVRDCEAPRKPFLDTIQRYAAGEGAFPTEVPLAIAQLGDMLISFVPAELTITAGYRLNSAVAKVAAASRSSATRTVIAGLANGYIQYVTTDEEYELQHYEGASVLYGIRTARFLEERYAMLARALAGFDASRWFKNPIDRVMPLTYFYSAERERFPTPSGTAISDIEGRGPRFICRLPGRSRSYCFGWKDAAPGDVPLADPNGLEASWLVVVDAATQTILRDPADPRGLLDDRGLAFQTRVQTRSGSGYDWTTVVDLPSFAIDPSRPLRIRVGAGATAVLSAPFDSTGITGVCKAKEVIECGIGR